MLEFVGRRIVHSAVSIAVLIVVVFVFARLTGDPAELYLPEDASEAVRAAFNAARGFDQPIHVQFWRFLTELAQGDLGRSMRLDIPSIEAVWSAMPTTLTLTAITMPIAFGLSVAIGALAAIRPGGPFDRLATIISLTAASMPEFWIAILAILTFAVGLHMLPSSGVGTPWHWVMPIGVLLVRPIGILVQVVRGAMIDALAAPYVKTARAKGAGNGVIVLVHCLRNALLPTITVASDQTIGLLSGAIIVELVFGFPGIGRLLLDAVTYRDYALLQAIVLVVAVAVFVVTAITDIAYSLFDPRVRHG
jgi:peptide/nickel transport system permease protein